MGRKHDIKPYDDQEPLHKLCEKNDASLFMLGSHSKKRPHNLTIGRLFNSKILDMVELGIESFKKMADFPNKANFTPGSKPIVIFQGERFEYADQFVKIRSLLSDVFRLYDTDKFDIAQAKKIMVFTVLNEKTIQLRCFTSNLPSAYDTQDPVASAPKEEIGAAPVAQKMEDIAAEPKEQKKEEVAPLTVDQKKDEVAATAPLTVEQKKEEVAPSQEPKKDEVAAAAPLTVEQKKEEVVATPSLPVEVAPQSQPKTEIAEPKSKVPATELKSDALIEVGPTVSFSVRRSYLSSEEDYRESLKKPKVIEKKGKKEKNIEHNEIGQTLGRLHVQQQDLSTLGLKHVRPIKPLKRKKVEEVKEEKEPKEGDDEVEMKEGQIEEADHEGGNEEMDEK